MAHDPALDPDRISNIFHDLPKYIGEVREFNVATGGVVHHVWQVRGEHSTAYLKIRGNTFARVPEIKTRPERIGAEASALKLFGDYAPDYFPNLIHYDDKLNYLLMSEVMAGEKTFANRLREDKPMVGDSWRVGYALGEVHAKTKSVTQDVRWPNDTRYRDEAMYYTFQRNGHPVLLKTLVELLLEPRQLIIGDLSPKNMYVSDTDVKFFDLETAHQNSSTYDIGYALAHLVMHSLKSDEQNEVTLAFMEGYRNHNNIDSQSETLIGVVAAAMLYRLDSPTLPYPLDIDRDALTARVYEALDHSSHKSVEKFIGFISR